MDGVLHADAVDNPEDEFVEVLINAEGLSSTVAKRIEPRFDS